MILNTIIKTNKRTYIKRCITCKGVFTDAMKNPFINKCGACFQKSSLLTGHCLIKLK